MDKAEFYQSIKADTPVTFNFCKMLYGYSMYDQAYLDAVLDKFRGFGRDKVKYIYGFYLCWELRIENEMLKPIARDMSEKFNKEFERKVKDAKWKKKQELLERRKQLLMQKSQI